MFRGFIYGTRPRALRARVCARLPLRSGVRVAGFVLQTGKHPSDLLNVAATVLAL